MLIKWTVVRLLVSRNWFDNGKYQLDKITKPYTLDLRTFKLFKTLKLYIKNLKIYSSKYFKYNKCTFINWLKNTKCKISSINIFWIDRYLLFFPNQHWNSIYKQFLQCQSRFAWKLRQSRTKSDQDFLWWWKSNSISFKYNLTSIQYYLKHSLLSTT